MIGTDADIVTHPFMFLDGWLLESEIKKIEEYCIEHGVEESKVIDQEGNLIPDTSVRKSNTKMHHINDENKWIFQKLADGAGYINSNGYKYDLTGFDYFQYTEYEGEGSEYQYHIDMLLGPAVPDGMTMPRKLSFSLILSDPEEYEGGEFNFKWGSIDVVKADQPRGRLLAFPSWMMHQVAPLKSGKRRSLVFWALGPRFK